LTRFLDEAKRLIQINSVSARGNEELANYVGSLFQDRGLKTQLQQVTHSLEDVSKRQFNVIGILGDPLVDKKIRKGLLLCTHLDTVGPGIPENWTESGGDPFAGAVKDGKIYGLGSADAKLDLLAKLQAVAKFREKKLKQPIYLVGTCGEELGMFGARYLIKSLALNPRYVLVAEPTALKIVYAHKGLNVFRISVGYQQVERDARGFNRRIDLHSFGRSAHGCYPHLGDSAILSAMDFLKRAGDAGFEVRFTKLDGGEAVNKVPDRALVQFYLTSHQLEDFKRFFRETVKATGREKSFRVELGGVGDSGVRFLPDALFPCLLDVVQFFRDLGKQWEQRSDEKFAPPYSTVNFGTLRQLLGGAELNFDVRLLPGVSLDEIEKHVQKSIQTVAGKYPSLNISVARVRMNPELNMTEQHELVKLCGEAMELAGNPVELSKASVSTEAAQFFQAGYESVVFGPGGSEGNTHSPNENCSLEQLEKARAFYERLIERVCT
jgi:acetylornithine deacetylase/succinyl-diaminopimelate desuccinylase-like protein